MNIRGIEPRPRSGTTRRYSSVKPTHRYYDSDSDSDDSSDDESSSDDSSDDESSSDDSSDDESSSDDSSDESDSDDDDYGCPSVNQIMGNGISTVCLYGRLFINGKEIQNVDSTDRVDIIGNKLRVNGKFIGKIPWSNNSSKSNRLAWGKITKKKCPKVTKINCENVSNSCINGQLYINNKKINVKPTDKVVIISNILRINGEFIRLIPPKKSNADSEHTERRRPSVVMNSCIGINTYTKNGKFFINDFELKNYKPTDKIRINDNDLYVNGKFIRHIKPKK
ncbi:hypothetical protein U1Q18_051009 [Sarracenia purpurea var. burkii]